MSPAPISKTKIETRLANIREAVVELQKFRSVSEADFKKTRIILPLPNTIYAGRWRPYLILPAIFCPAIRILPASVRLHIKGWRPKWAKRAF